ncbi:MAG TPA: hypothetical protein VK402_16985 [Blastococcus sp.]|nr:hypothetical protein [Blastococcus sp.]
MSIRLPSARRTASVTLVAAAVLVGASGGMALADPPALNRDDCAASLAHAGEFPGTMSFGSGSIRLVSDAYDGYLSRSAACAPDPTTR